MNSERQFERMAHGQVVRISSTIKGNSVGVASSILRDHGLDGVGPGKLEPKQGTFKFVVEFVEKAPETYPEVERDAEHKHPDRIRLRLKNSEKGSMVGGQYLTFQHGGKMGLTCSKGMDTEMYVYPLKFKTYFKFESVKFPSSMMQCGHKDGTFLAHGVGEFGGNCSTFVSDSLFSDIEEVEKQLYDPSVSPAQDPVPLPLGEVTEFHSLRCVGHKKVLKHGSFDHAAYKFRVIDRNECAWHVWHRFSVVGDLHKELCSEMKMGEGQMPSLPDKGSMFKSESSEKLLVERQEGFDKFCIALAERVPHFGETQAMTKFTRKTGPPGVVVIGGNKQGDFKRVNGNNGKFDHTAFRLRVSYNSLSWSVNKRFRNLRGAVIALRTEFSDVPEVVAMLSSFPSASNVLPQSLVGKLPKVLGSFFNLVDHKEEDFLNKRSLAIETFLDELSHFPQVGRSREWLRFLSTSE